MALVQVGQAGVWLRDLVEDIMTTAKFDHQLVLGGARSGKSAHALQLAEAIGPRRRFLATAEAWDAEMTARVAAHRAERGNGWQTTEECLDLAGALAECDDDVVVIDCLTLWLSNLMGGRQDPEAATDALITALQTARQPVIMVSNEVGLALVPETELGRRFRDAQGLLNQKVAEAVTKVDLVVAGLVLAIKS